MLKNIGNGGKQMIYKKPEYISDIISIALDEKKLEVLMPIIMKYDKIYAKKCLKKYVKPVKELYTDYIHDIKIEYNKYKEISDSPICRKVKNIRESYPKTQ